MTTTHEVASANEYDDVEAHGLNGLQESASSPDEVIIPSPFTHVPDSAWTEFVRAMMVSDFEKVSPSNTLGIFEVTVRRLNDLGLITNMKRTQSKKSGKTIWVGKFVPPLTDKAFLKNPQIQYAVFKSSMVEYYRLIMSDEVQIPPGVSLSGALVLLHKAGPKGLSGKRFTATQTAFEKVNGLF